MIYVVSSKNLYAVERLLEEAKIMSRGVGSTFGSNYELRIMDLKSLISCRFRIPMLKGDVLYIRNPYLNGSPKYLPQIIKLAKKFQAQGGRVVDVNIAKGKLGKGKWEDYKQLSKFDLSFPNTELFSLKSEILNHKSYILKWIYGMKAKGAFLIQNQQQLKKIVAEHPHRQWLLQEFIQAKYEYKVICIGYKALPVVLRFKFNPKLGRVDFNSYNILTCYPGHRSRSQKIKNYHSDAILPFYGVGGEGVKKVINLAEKASKILGRELSKVDILEDNSGKLYTLEVNRFPGLKSFEQLTQYNVVKEFLNYLIFPKSHLPKE